MNDVRIFDAPTIVLKLDMDKENESIDMYEKALAERVPVEYGDFTYLVSLMEYERGLGIAICTVTLIIAGRRNEKDTTR